MMKRIYTRVVEWSDEDGCYLGSLPELLYGHCTHGDSIEEVNRNLDECEELALESRSDVPARGVQVYVPSRRRNWVPGNSIASLRASVGMSQQEFANRLGASVSTLRKWERGERKPSGAAAKLLVLADRNPDIILSL